MLPSLRIDPTNPSSGIINTIHNIIIPIANSEKYRNSLRLVHTEGTSEQTELYEIIYTDGVQFKH